MSYILNMRVFHACSFFFFFFPPSVRFYSEAGAERDVQRYEGERRWTLGVVGVEPGGDRHAVQPQDRDARVRRGTGDIRSERVRLARASESPDRRGPRGKPMERSHGPEKRSTTFRTASPTSRRRRATRRHRRQEAKQTYHQRWDDGEERWSIDLTSQSRSETEEKRKLQLTDCVR